MRPYLKTSSILLGVLFFVFTPFMMWGQQAQGQLSQPPQRQVLRGHVPAAAAQLKPLNRLAGAERLHLAVALPLLNHEALIRLPHPL